MIFFSGNHKGSQVGGVYGKEHHREQRPDAGHEPGRARGVKDTLFLNMGGLIIDYS